MTARGIRLKNPGNLVHGSKWDGLSPVQTDSKFAEFDEAIMGIRALMKTLLTYQWRYELLTVHDMITRWAPPSENDTDAYIADVANDMGIGEDISIKFVNFPSILIAMARAIVKHENGSIPYDLATFADALLLALPDEKIG